MATVTMRHRDSGELKKGFYGFSWTTLCFGMFPALFRKDYMTFMALCAVAFILGILTVGVGSAIAMAVWAFFYNKHYTKRLIEDGYVFDDDEAAVAAARQALKVAA